MEVKPYRSTLKLEKGVIFLKSSACHQDYLGAPPRLKHPRPVVGHLEAAGVFIRAHCSTVAFLWGLGCGDALSSFLPRNLFLGICFRVRRWIDPAFPKHLPRSRPQHPCPMARPAGKPGTAEVPDPAGHGWALMFLESCPW